MPISWHLPKGWKISADGVDSADRARAIAKERRQGGKQARVVRHIDRTLSGKSYMTHAVIVKD